MSVQGTPVYLTETQFRLLTHLIKNEGRALSRDDLLRDVWGYRGDVVTRTVDIHVHRLRAKLRVAGDLIATVRSIGYRFSLDDDPAAGAFRRG